MSGGDYETYDTAAVAQRLGVGKKTAQAFMQAAKGKGAFKLAGRFWRIKVEDFERIIDDLKTKCYEILLVEDSPTEILRFRQAVGRILVPLHLIVAADSGAALACIVALAPDLVILDISLPCKRGPELLREIQRLHLPTLVYAGVPNAEQICQALDLGVMDVISKEAHIARIQTLIRKAIGARVRTAAS